MNKYILDETGEPVPVEDTLFWGRWFESNDKLRRVGSDTIGDAQVSTVFLGLDHGHSDDGKPLIWETMIFGGKHDQYQQRCSGRREQVEAMHKSL